MLDIPHADPEMKEVNLVEKVGVEMKTVKDSIRRLKNLAN